MKFVFLLIVSALSAVILARVREGVIATAPDLNLAEQVNADVRDEKSLAYAMAKIVTSEAPNPQKKFEQLAERQDQIRTGREVAELALARIQLSGDEERLKNILGRDEAGARLLKILMSARHQSQVLNASVLQGALMSELKKDADASYRAMVGAYERLDEAQFGSEKSTLLFLMHMMPGHVEDAKRIAAQTFEGDDSASSLGLVLQSHALMLKQTTDGRGALAVTIDGILSQNTSLGRNMIASHFLGVHPELRNELFEELRRKGISLAVPGK